MIILTEKGEKKTIYSASFQSSILDPIFTKL